MIINENGWGDKPKEVKETKESVKAKKIKQLNEEVAVETESSENAEQE